MPSYQGVCPANLEREFLAEYNAGHHLYELESALHNADARIAGDYRAQENIKQELTSIAATMIAADTTAEQRVRLVTRSAELGRHFGELTREIEQLQRDRAGIERDLLRLRAHARGAQLSRASARTSSRSVSRLQRRRWLRARQRLARVRRSLALALDRSRDRG